MGKQNNAKHNSGSGNLKKKSFQAKNHPTFTNPKKIQSLSKHDAVTKNKSNHNQNTSNSNHSIRNQPVTSSAATASSKSNTSKLSDLQLKFSKKLEGGRFRFINEQLYTSKGKESFENFQGEPELFDVYHSGYREQVASWPENPLDRIISWIKKHHPKAIIADMGCGEARLAESVKNKVHSYDLVSRKASVTACDIAHTPLPNHSVDIVVFCLSLMGSNITDFIREAYRILNSSGILKIIEVRSRFESDTGGVKKFLKVLKRGGFSIVNKGLDSNTMFFEVECTKNSDVRPNYDETYSAKACLYKRR